MGTTLGNDDGCLIWSKWYKLSLWVVYANPPPWTRVDETS
jgi:hypothetical protein